jgi:hypothetical protein
MKTKFIITTVGVFFGFAFFVHAQQTPSPLINSFRTYKEMKEESKFNLNWISLAQISGVGARNRTLRAHPCDGYRGIETA